MTTTIKYRLALQISHAEPVAHHYRVESLDGSPVTTATAESVAFLLPDDAAAHVVPGHLVFNQWVRRERSFTAPTIITERELTEIEATIYCFSS